jgi:hypothetical protein
MLKKEVTYTDFDGNKVTEVLHFYLSEAQLMRLDAQYPDGLEAAIRSMVERDDRGSIFKLFEELIVLSYGTKSEDGKRFVRSEESKTEFLQSLAYDTLLVDIATSEATAIAFFQGVTARALGKHLKKEAEAVIKQ